MSAKDTIKKQLQKVYTEGEINAADISKGWQYDGMTFDYGWHFIPFNETPIFMGKSVADCIVTIGAWMDDKETMHQEWLKGQ